MDSLILGLRVLVALGAVLGLIWVLQRRLLKGKTKGRRRANTTLTVVSRQNVGQKASVVVVDAGDKRFLLGVTEHAVNVLHSSDIPAELPQAAPAPETFAEIFRDAGLHGESGLQGEAGLHGTALTRRSEIHRRSEQDNPQPMHGSILAGSTWRQAAEAIRGRRN